MNIVYLIHIKIIILFNNGVRVVHEKDFQSENYVGLISVDNMLKDLHQMYNTVPMDVTLLTVEYSVNQRNQK